MAKFVCDRVENIVGKGENTGYQHFLFFSQCVQKLSFSESLKLGLCCKDLNLVGGEYLLCVLRN